jgi:hypothetical protein
MPLDSSKSFRALLLRLVSLLDILPVEAGSRPLIFLSPRLPLLS